MKRVLCRAAVGLAALLGGIGGGWGCSDEETGFLIVGNVAVVEPACVARPDQNSNLFGSGVLDVALKLDYQASLLVGSQLTPRGDKTNLRTETQITAMTGAEVRLYEDDGRLSLEFTVPASGVIFPETADEPGFAIINATLIPASAGRDLAVVLTDRAARRTRVVEVRVFGKTLGGNEVESAWFTYVIQVCAGCLVDYEPASLDGMNRCRVALDDAPEPPCRLGQDDVVDCRLCRGSYAICDTAP
jgi:hypothetical protein